MNAMEPVGCDKARQFLEDQGFVLYFQKADASNVCNWYSCLRQDDLPECQCNEKPPQIVAWPSERQWHVCGPARNIGLEITAESDDVWVRVEAFNVPEDELVDKYAVWLERLRMAYRAIMGGSNV